MKCHSKIVEILIKPTTDFVGFPVTTKPKPTRLKKNKKIKIDFFFLQNLEKKKTKNKLLQHLIFNIRANFPSAHSLFLFFFA
jgi:hypothetical protein